MTLPAIYTLDEAASKFGWSRQTLTRALARHGIAPVGKGRIARLTEIDVLKLLEAERCHTNYSHPASAASTGASVEQSVMRELRKQRARRIEKELRNGRTSTSSDSVIPLSVPEGR
jgi:RNA 3'-terminal phosphate cyclase